MKRILFLFLALFIFWGVNGQNKPSTVREYKKVFKTYDFSDPDPIARPEAIYPYYRFDGYTDTPVSKEWKVVELENEFIRVMILPEIGGKIWGAWDKATGKPFIYYNQVVKFRDVAMRGAWTSGGIEANYGIIGHTPNVATPVDYLTGKKADGSASCTIGTLDLLTQTYWTLEISLPASKAYFTTTSFWHNSTSLEQPYYTWMNVGIKAAGNLEFIYPGNRYIGHGGEYAEWKINQKNGKDISFYEQNNFGGPKSYHVFGGYTDFFGGYWHNENFGMGRYGLHDEKPGKKIWIWGLSPQGMIWEKLLSDTDGQYVEVQSGRLFNQSAEGSTYTPFKHLGFAPATSDSWTEYWFPVKDIGGFVKANPFGALNIRMEKDLLKINFSPLQDIQDELKVLEGDRVIYSKTVNLKTLQAFADSVGFKGNAKNLIVTLGNKMKYESTPEAGLLNRPVDSPADFDWKGVQGLYLLGKESLRQRHFADAEEKLTAALAKEPNYLPALADMSLLMYRKMEYQKALDFARHALSIDTYDPAGNFYYALANLQLGNIIDARDGFDIASLSAEYRGGAWVELSKIYFRENDFAKAAHYANKSISVNSANVDAWQVLAVISRINRDEASGKKYLEKINSLNPLNHFARFENYRTLGSADSKAKFTSLIRNEMPHETYLQMADWYLTLGLTDEALEVLKCAPAHAEIYYWMAYLENKLKDGLSSTHIDKANSLSAELVFPFRSRSAEVLEWVISQSQNWKPKYYLALVYWSRNEQSRAHELFAQCGAPDFAPFYALRAALRKDDQAIGDLKKAAQLDPQQWRYGKLLINRLAEEKNYTEALAVAKQYHALLPGDFRLSMLLAKALLWNKQYKACNDLLSQTTILPYEGATDGRLLYAESWLSLAVTQIKSGNYKAALTSIGAARRWPENLGVGKPYDEDIDSRLEDYLEAICLEKTKNSALAAKKWNAIVDYKGKEHGINVLITALALKQRNRSDEGEKLLADWLQKEPENKLAKWANEIYKGNKPAEDFEGNETYRVLKLL